MDCKFGELRPNNRDRSKLIYGMMKSLMEYKCLMIRREKLSKKLSCYIAKIINLNKNASGVRNAGTYLRI